MATDEDKREEGWKPYLRLGSWDKIVFFPIWFPCFLCATLFSSVRVNSRGPRVTEGRERKKNLRLLKVFYKQKGFAPYAIELILIGLILLLFSIDAAWDAEERAGQAFNIEKAVFELAMYSVFLGVGYFLYKLFDRGVSEDVGVSKNNSSEAEAPPVQAPPPPPTT